MYLVRSEFFTVNDDTPIRRGEKTKKNHFIGFRSLEWTLNVISRRKLCAHRPGNFRYLLNGNHIKKITHYSPFERFTGSSKIEHCPKKRKKRRKWSTDSIPFLWVSWWYVCCLWFVCYSQLTVFRLNPVILERRHFIENLKVFEKQETEETASAFKWRKWP